MFRRNFLVGLLLLFVSSFGYTQPNVGPSVRGQVFIHNRNGPAPIPAQGYRVALYSPQQGWSAPSVVDRYGGYALFNIPSGNYTLQVYSTTNRLVWRQQVRTGTVPAIVLPNP